MSECTTGPGERDKATTKTKSGCQLGRCVPVPSEHLKSAISRCTKDHYLPRLRARLSNDLIAEILENFKGILYCERTTLCLQRNVLVVSA
jgi:hypothetical protein